MAKYRIIERNGRFRPQEKFFLFWFSFDDSYLNFIEYNSLEKARCFIERQKRETGKWRVVEAID